MSAVWVVTCFAVVAELVLGFGWISSDRKLRATKAELQRVAAGVAREELRRWLDTLPKAPVFSDRYVPFGHFYLLNERMVREATEEKPS